MITVKLNDVLVEIEENVTVNQLLQQINSGPGGIAVAVNDKIISKDFWEENCFSQNDHVLIIKATQGG